MNEPPTSNQPLSAHEVLRELPLFAHLSAQALTELESELEYFALPGGATLFEHGEISDALYVLKSGSLGAFQPRSDATTPDYELTGIIAAGETVGELGLIVDQPRSATVRALRDSELLRLSRRGFENLVKHHPQAMLLTARIAVRRLITRNVSGKLSAPRTFSIVPHHRGIDARAFALRFRKALASYGDCAFIDRDAGHGQISNWYSALESRVRYVIYLADSEPGSWRELCIRQADCLVLLAQASDEAAAWPLDIDVNAALHRPRHLVLVHRNEARFGVAERWLGFLPGAQHHHVRQDSDIERVARLLIGRSLGLVLSGGGARGFAHIGVVKALREAGMQIDSVGGTSIGAIIGAGVAADWSTDELIEKNRQAFVVGHPLADYTFPFISLVRGRRVSRLLRESFGSRDIADLALPYYCVAANLTAGQAVTYRQGPLWLWLRASCAIPGILPPVLHRGQVLVDGAVINNLPVDIMRERNIGDVIGVDIGADDVLHTDIEEHALPALWQVAWERLKRHRRPGILSILLRSGMVNAEAASIARRAQTSLLLTPPLNDIDLLDWKAYDRAIEAGYQYTLRVIGGQKDALAEQTPLAL